MTIQPTDSTERLVLTGERGDLLETLTKHRYFLRFTVRDLTDEQAARRTTASQLCLGGLIKHVAETEQSWINFILGGPQAMGADWNDADWNDTDSNEPEGSAGGGSVGGSAGGDVTDEGPAEDGSGTGGFWTDQFAMLPGETLGGLLERYTEVARRTDELVATLPDLDAAQPLPEAPWFEKDASWSARRVLLHVIAETAQHAGHADIIRESLDGAKSMG